MVKYKLLIIFFIIPSFNSYALLQHHLIVDPAKVGTKNSQIVKDEVKNKEKQLTWYSKIAKDTTDAIEKFLAKNKQASYKIKHLSTTDTETSNLSMQEKYEPAQSMCDTINYIANKVTQCDFLYSDETDNSSGLSTKLNNDSAKNTTSERFDRLIKRLKTDNYKNNTLSFSTGSTYSLKNIPAQLATVYQQTMVGVPLDNINKSRKEVMDALVELVVNGNSYQIKKGNAEYNKRILSNVNREKLITNILKSSYSFRTAADNKQSREAAIIHQFNTVQDWLEKMNAPYKSNSGSFYRPPLSTVKRDLVINNITNLSRKMYIYETLLVIQEAVALRTQVLTEIETKYNGKKL